MFSKEDRWQHRSKPGRKKKKIRKLSEKQRVFIDKLVETGDQKEAKALAGYKPTANPLASPNVTKEYEEKVQILKEKFVNHADEMCENMVNLARTSKSDSVKFQATKDILDRAGLAPVSKSETETKNYIDVGSRFARGAIERYLKENTIDVTPTEKDPE